MRGPRNQWNPKSENSHIAKGENSLTLWTSASLQAGTAQCLESLPQSVVPLTGDTESEASVPVSPAFPNGPGNLHFCLMEGQLRTKKRGWGSWRLTCESPKPAHGPCPSAGLCRPLQKSAHWARPTPPCMALQTAPSLQQSAGMPAAGWLCRIGRKCTTSPAPSPP